MESITHEIRSDIVTNKVNLLKVTVNEANTLRILLDEQTTFGHSRIVVDLSKCTHLDSTFIGVLVVIQKKLKLKGGELKLVNPLDPAKEVFFLTGITNTFETFDFAEDALKSFCKDLNPPKPKSINIKPQKSIEWVFA